jgi:outer membrane protein insertion porin family
MFTRNAARYGMAGVMLCISLLLGLAQERRVESVAVRGLRNISETAVIAALRLKPGEPFSEATLESDRRAIEAMGLFSDVRPRVEQTETGVRVEFEVVENPLIREVRFTGNTVFSNGATAGGDAQQARLRVQHQLRRAGHPRDSRRLRARGLHRAARRLHPADYENGILTIALSELRVGEIRVEGNTKTRTNVILREMRTKPGDLFNTQRFQRDINRLYNTGYFDQIAPEDSLAAPGVIDLTLKVKERPTGRLNVGFAIDSRRRLIGLAEVFETNFRGTGRTVGVNFQSTGGRNGSSIEVLFTEPYLDRRRTSLSVSLYNKLVYRFTSNFFGGQLDPNLEQQYDERRRGVTIGLSRPLSELLTASVGLRAEDVNTNRVATNQGGGFIRQDGTLSSLSLRGVYNNRDFDLDPAQGQYLALTLEPGFTNIRSAEQQFIDSGVVKLGQSSFVRASIDYRLYYSPQGRRTQPDDRRQVFAIRAYYGAISGTVPFFEQFFIGGAETLRGYPEDRFWGKNAALLSFEFRQPIEKAFTAVFFVDIGHAWGGYPSVNDFLQRDRFRPEVGYGLGVRVRTPLGPLRIDYGIGRDGGRTHFSVGQVF